MLKRANTMLPLYRTVTVHVTATTKVIHGLQAKSTAQGHSVEGKGSCQGLLLESESGGRLRITDGV